MFFLILSMLGVFVWFPISVIRRVGLLKGSLCVTVIFLGIFIWSRVDTNQKHLLQEKARHHRSMNLSIAENKNKTFNDIDNEFHEKSKPLNKEDINFFTFRRYESAWTAYKYGLRKTPPDSDEALMVKEIMDRHYSELKSGTDEIQKDRPNPQIEHIVTWKKAMYSEIPFLIVYWAIFIVTLWVFFFKPSRSSHQ